MNPEGILGRRFSNIFGTWAEDWKEDSSRLTVCGYLYAPCTAPQLRSEGFECLVGKNQLTCAVRLRSVTL